MGISLRPSLYWTHPLQPLTLYHEAIIRAAVGPEWVATTARTTMIAPVEHLPWIFQARLNAIKVHRPELHNPPCAKPPPARHLPQPKFLNNPPRALRRNLKRLGDHAGRDQRPRHDKFDELRQPG